MAVVSGDLQAFFFSTGRGRPEGLIPRPLPTRGGEAVEANLVEVVVLGNSPTVLVSEKPSKPSSA